jgi:hypothetical protein
VERSGMFPAWAKGVLAILVVALGLVVGAWLHSSLGGSEKTQAVTRQRTNPPTPRRRPVLPVHTDATKLPPASAGLNHSHRPSRSSEGEASLQNSFASLEAGMSGSIGLAVAPLGSAPIQTYGQLQVGHAWSSMKVPIIVTLMREGGLSGEEEAWARSAVTASDNEAAAALFDQIENARGGLAGASQAVQETLALAGDTSTQVATAPPPPGAVSTWGQTEWSLSGSVAFYRALACGALVDSAQSGYVLGLMEEVISEQQWGLGQASFSSGSSVAFKAGWGPEAETGGYLVRQAGVIRTGNSGLVVTMMAEDSSGSFEAGVADVNQVASWVSDHYQGLSPSSC